MMIVFVRSLLMFILLTECTGNKVIVQSNGSTAVLNKDFSFKCSLSHGNVKQVTWQKQKDKEGSITGKSCFTVFGISEMNIEKFSTKSENIIVVSCSVTGKPSPMIAWQTSENITEHEMEIKEDDKGIVTIISNVTVDLSTFQAKEISCYAYLQNPTRPEERQEVEKTIIVRIRDVPSRVGTIVGVCGILLIIVTVIAVIVMPAVFVGNTRILSSSSVVFETFSE
ncbi:OX-2 membrane glycoprotein-like [Acipenser oxyrinchus oxyrinchus]|uniref:OX-2 membrane glycoprotein-like n=1 Tax=Acipenser oxyrinchus oxyrinchus TaxID=40147 RepID=A0AAD8CKF5_ACIOX|nr:OX-2 membrane glycoprotein-like [Acipenser oxyrinchus oxyrinchus]